MVLNMSENGVAEARPGILRLGDLSPSTRPVSIERDGRDVTLKGYVWGRRIPRSVEIRVHQAYDELPKEFTVRTRDGEVMLDDAGQALTDIKFSMSDYHEMLSRVACALVEGLSPLEAELLSPDEMRALLEYLEYLKPEDTRREAEPERPLAGPTMTSTGETSPSDSPQPLDSSGASN